MSQNDVTTINLRELTRTKRRSSARRTMVNHLFNVLCIVVALSSVVLLVFFLFLILSTGVRNVDWHFLTTPATDDPSSSGFYPAILGTVWLLVIVALFTIPIGVSAAVILEEFRPKNRYLRYAHALVQTNITNLAGVPSVVYGIIGLTIFVFMFNISSDPDEPFFEVGIKYYDQYYNRLTKRAMLKPVDDKEAPVEPAKDGMRVLIDGKWVEMNVVEFGDPLPPKESDEYFRTVYAGTVPTRFEEPRWYHMRIPFGRGVLAGGLTLMLVVLPILIIASQEAIRSVPDSLRQAALGMGSTRWQVVQNVTLPAAIPGIMTGSILAMSRAIGEAAPLLLVSSIIVISTAPSNLMSEFTAMPLQIYNWAKDPNQDFHPLASAGIIVLLGVLLLFNAIAVFIRHKFQKPLS